MPRDDRSAQRECEAPTEWQQMGLPDPTDYPDLNDFDPDRDSSDDEHLCDLLVEARAAAIQRQEEERRKREVSYAALLRRVDGRARHVAKGRRQKLAPPNQGKALAGVLQAVTWWESFGEARRLVGRMALVDRGDAWRSQALRSLLVLLERGLRDASPAQAPLFRDAITRAMEAGESLELSIPAAGTDIVP